MYKSMKMIKMRAVKDLVTHQEMTPMAASVRMLKTMKNQYRLILRTLKVATFLNSQKTF